ncbi:hypothetical protein [Actinokineospora inagensis]|uniref:hypothetical protein n=1 Tax=Actinokineospora inagensis TaxID=103730 RepID=UPI000410043A|nr:hypothetical protein [Actinokineospora inagensis]
MDAADGGGALLGGVIGGAMGEFAALAASGGFEVNEHGGQALLTAIHNMIEWLDSQRSELVNLRERAKLGSSTNAEVMKPFMQQVASDGQGFLTQLAQLRDSLGTAEKAITQAMANYRATDDLAAGSLG